MQRRGGGKRDADGDGIHHPPPRRGEQRPSSVNVARRSSRNGCRFGFACALLVLFSALLAVEFMAFTMLGGTPATASMSTTASSADSTASAAARSSIRDKGDAKGDSTPLKKIRPPPSPVNKLAAEIARDQAQEQLADDRVAKGDSSPMKNISPPSTLVNELAAEVARGQAHEQQAVDRGRLRVNSAKTSAPGPANVTSKVAHDQTYEPTDEKYLSALMKFKSSHEEYSRFWKTHAPDPVPPLPLDTDPVTGEKLPPVIAYVTTLTDCGGKYGGLDGAAVLLHSIRRNSHGWIPMAKQLTDITSSPRYGGEGGRYRYRAYVIVDPKASPDNPDEASGACARFLEKIGYTILHRASLVPLFEVKDKGDDGSDNQFYKEWKNMGYVGKQRASNGPTARRPVENPDKLPRKMEAAGCCGYYELLKLHVYGMVEHELVVHLDFDSLLLRPMDDLFDVMLGKGGNVAARRRLLPLARLPRTREVDFSRPIDAAFTRDYNSMKKPSVNSSVGIQGGFLVVRPDLEVLERFRTILQRGEFVLGPPSRDGWGGKHGGFYGDVTFQGILPYYYEDVAPEGQHNEVELDRCIYNQMADNPRKSTHKFPRATPLDPKKMGFSDTNICRDGREDCSDTDCQRTHPKASITTHFTFCEKPWDCPDGHPGTVVYDTCSGLLEEWYRVRRELEDWWLSPSTDNSQSHYWNDETLAKVHASRLGGLDSVKHAGYCDDYGTGGYRRLVEPDEPKPEKNNPLLH